jgi:glycosyltransferase involved in cell wall biosynthesis
MVSLMLEGFGGDRRGKSGGNVRPAAAHSAGCEEVFCYHVNTRFSDDIADMGRIRLAKFLLVFRYCFEAIVCRFRYGITCFYFATAPPKKGALYRDLLVMLCCRPFFRHIIHHWHGVGLGDWLQHSRTAPERWVAHWLLGKPSLGITLAAANLRDPLWFRSREVAIVPNGIPDPFPDFDESLRTTRMSRLQIRRRLIGAEPLEARHADDEVDARVFRILYLAHCFREKGIFETLDGVAQASRLLCANAHPLRLELTVAGDFASADDRHAFDQRVAASDLRGLVRYTGFVSGAEKDRLLRESDCLCFPTYTDSFGLVVLEAMAAGLSVIATLWRALPEILPPDYPGFVPIRDGTAIGRILPQLFLYDATELREHFLAHFTVDAHLRKFREALAMIARR